MNRDTGGGEDMKTPVPSKGWSWERIRWEWGVLTLHMKVLIVLLVGLACVMLLLQVMGIMQPYISLPLMFAIGAGFVGILRRQIDERIDEAERGDGKKEVVEE